MEQKENDKIINTVDKIIEFENDIYLNKLYSIINNNTILRDQIRGYQWNTYFLNSVKSSLKEELNLTNKPLKDILDYYNPIIEETENNIQKNKKKMIKIIKKELTINKNSI